MVVIGSASEDCASSLGEVGGASWRGALNDGSAEDADNCLILLRLSSALSACWAARLFWSFEAVAARWAWYSECSEAAASVARWAAC